MKTKRWIGCCSWWYMRNVMFHVPHSSEPHQGVWRRKASSHCLSQKPCSAPLCDYRPEVEVVFSALYHILFFLFNNCLFFYSITWSTIQFCFLSPNSNQSQQINYSKSTNQSQLNLRCQLWIASYMPAHIEAKIRSSPTAWTNAVPVKADAWGKFMPNRYSALDIWSK